ncbi:MAG: hypothetical protein AAF990_14150 [Bacteroidota bacterium]
MSLKHNHQIIEDQIRGILDARIQYIDYQTNQIVSSITGIDFQSVHKPDLSVKELNEFNFAHNQCDSFLTAMEEFSKTKRALLLLRAKLRPNNGQLILDLLQDQKYISMTEKQLERYLEEHEAAQRKKDTYQPLSS